MRTDIVLGYSGWTCNGADAIETPDCIGADRTAEDAGIKAAEEHGLDLCFPYGDQLGCTTATTEHRVPWPDAAYQAVNDAMNDAALRFLTHQGYDLG